MIREQCRAREDFERHERTVQKRLADQEAALKEKDSQIQEKNSHLQEQSAKLKAYEKLLKDNNIPH